MIYEEMLTAEHRMGMWISFQQKAEFANDNFSVKLDSKKETLATSCRAKTHLIAKIKLSMI